MRRAAPPWPRFPARLARCPDALSCVLALDPQRYSRNRYFAAYLDPLARRAHARALRARSLAEQLRRLGSGAGVRVEVRERGERTFISYRDDRVRLGRTIVLGRLDTSLLRLLLTREAAPVPHELRLREGDVRRVREALGAAGVALPPDPRRGAQGARIHEGR
jgi:hypothetical protein